MVDDPVANWDATERARAHERLLAMLDARDTGQGVWFDYSRAWLISALRGVTARPPRPVARGDPTYADVRAVQIRLL